VITRILTALILIPLVILSIFYLPLFAFTFITAVIFLIAAWEWTRLMEIKRIAFRIIFLIITLIVFCVFLVIPPGLLLSLALLTWLIITYCLFHFEWFGRFWTRHFVFRALLGWWVLGLGWYGLNFIRAQHMGSIYVLLLLLWVWSADTGAYFIGRWLGKTKLAPQISPGKSIAGFWGGIGLALLVALIVSFFLPHGITYHPEIFILALITALVSVLGDLFESMVKRQSGTKDSGHLLPGHGGMLDRIDSLISTAPIFAAILWFLLYFK